MFLRDHARIIARGVLATVDALVDQAKAHHGVAMPGRTHLQHAQPVLLSHHLLAHAWALLRDVQRLQDWDKRAGVSPYGSGALAGSSLGLDPEAVAADLGFYSAAHNSIDGTASRDVFAEFAWVCSMIGVDLSRISEEVILWATKEFSFVTLHDSYSTGSSIMPQKKNPDVAELARGKAGRLIGFLNALLITLKGLPLGYSKDLQEDKEPIFDAVDAVLLTLAVLPEMLRTAHLDKERMAGAASGFALATDLADFLAAQDVAFREAHQVIGRLVRRCEELGVTLEEVPREELAAAHPALADLPRELLTPEGSVASKRSYGSTAPTSVAAQLDKARRFLRSL